MRELTRREVVAMWLFGEDYAKSGLSAIEWCKRLRPSRAGLVEDFIAQYERARARDLAAASPEGR